MRHVFVLLTCLAAVAALVVAEGCRPNLNRSDGDADGDVDGDGDADIPCESLFDTDGDTIADQHEGDGDLDGDGVANHLDDDSDGDGISDREEAGDDDICTHPANHDTDEWPDAYDRDSDNDGLSDADEVSGDNPTDPYNPDSDGDGFTDLAEVAAGVDPNDEWVGIPEGDFFVVLPYGGPEEHRNLTFGTDIEIADVYFLVDTTASMSDTISDVVSSLESVIVPGIQATIDDAWIGVGRFEDFTISSYGSSGTHAGVVPGLPTGDVPFFNHTVVRDPNTEMALIMEAVGYLAHTGIGGDVPESHTEGLYQTATGEGNPGFVDPQVCEVRPDDPVPPRGYPCFRPGALPIVVLVTDADMHNGPGGSNSYVGVPGHTVDEAITELNAIGARVIGVGSAAMSAAALTDMEYVATGTGTVDVTGAPLVYDCAAEVSYDVVDAISDLAGGTPQDVSTTTEDLPDWDEYLARGEPEVDARGFIRAIRPSRAIPPEGVTGGIDDTTFRMVIPGTRVEFEVVFQNDFVGPRDTSRIYEALIIVLGNGVARLDERHVYIVVPPEGEEILI